MKIPRTSIQTTWKSDWLLEFGIIIAILGGLTREIMTLSTVGIGIILTLVTLGTGFARSLARLRNGLFMQTRLSRRNVFLGDSVQGELLLRNDSKTLGHILDIGVVPGKELSIELESRAFQGRLLPPRTVLRSRLTIRPLTRGRHQILGFMLTFTDRRSLFEAQVEHVGLEWLEVHPRVGKMEPLTPLALYGSNADVVRKTRSGVDFAGIREYAPGDEYHRVEWKATARLRVPMVKEFHPETQFSVALLIDGGRTMQQRSYVGSRLDEAMAVTQLLLESTVKTGHEVGVWVYDGSRILTRLEPAQAEEQLPRFRALTLRITANQKGEEGFVTTRRITSPLSKIAAIQLDAHVAVFIQLLKARLRLDVRKSGAYKALTEATSLGTPSLAIILSDLQMGVNAIIEDHLQQKITRKVVVAQIGSAWRFKQNLEDAYLEQRANERLLRELRHRRIEAFDVRPEEMLEVVNTSMREPLAIATSDS
jgi:uncharacterized protein (DUF58 family)